MKHFVVWVRGEDYDQLEENINLKIAENKGAWVSNIYFFNMEDTYKACVAYILFELVEDTIEDVKELENANRDG